MTISAVINTRNAAATLSEALASVTPWVDEVLVVDMHSTDATREIAARHGARVLFHEPMGFVEPARAWSVEQAIGEWIVLLDADEVLPCNLTRRLQEIAMHNEADVVDIPELNFFFGEPMLHGRWHPNDQRHKRFFRRGMIELSARVHATPTVVPGARVLILDYEPGLAISHFAYTTVDEFLSRTDRYTSVDIEAPMRSMRLQMRRVLSEIRSRLVLARGFRDGSRGFALAVLMGVYEWTLWLKLVERQNAIQRPIGITVVRRCLSWTTWSLRVLERVRWDEPEKIRMLYLAEARRLVAEYQDTEPSGGVPSDGEIRRA